MTHFYVRVYTVKVRYLGRNTHTKQQKQNEDGKYSRRPTIRTLILAILESSSGLQQYQEYLFLYCLYPMIFGLFFLQHLDLIELLLERVKYEFSCYRTQSQWIRRCPLDQVDA